jgi:hypothetical protein
MSVEQADFVACGDLLRVHNGLAVAKETNPELTYSSWTPAGMRTIRKRRFTALSVDGVPTLVSKVALDDEDVKVAREWEILTSLHLPNQISTSVPVAETPTGFIMGWAAGRDLPDALRPFIGTDTGVRLLEQTIDLISSMHLMSATHNPSREEADAAAAQYIDLKDLQRIGLSESVHGALVGPTHGDLAPWNIRYDDKTDSFTFIDWEDFRPAGIASMDVLNVLITLSLAIYPDYKDHGFDWLYEKLFESDDWYALQLPSLIQRYARAIGKSERSVMNLVPFFCLWLPARLRAEGRDPAGLYYDRFSERYRTTPPQWVKDLPDEQ